MQASSVAHGTARNQPVDYLHPVSTTSAEDSLMADASSLQIPDHHVFAQSPSLNNTISVEFNQPLPLPSGKSPPPSSEFFQFGCGESKPPTPLTNFSVKSNSNNPFGQLPIDGSAVTAAAAERQRLERKAAATAERQCLKEAKEKEVMRIAAKREAKEKE